MQEKRQKKNIGGIIDKKYFTKEELQDHDRELVKEVCEKIKQFCNEEKNQIEDFCGWTSILKSNLDKFLDQLQKEFEDENNEN